MGELGQGSGGHRLEQEQVGGCLGGSRLLSFTLGLATMHALLWEPGRPSVVLEASMLGHPRPSPHWRGEEAGVFP